MPHSPTVGRKQKKKDEAKPKVSPLRMMDDNSLPEARMRAVSRENIYVMAVRSVRTNPNSAAAVTGHAHDFS